MKKLTILIIIICLFGFYSSDAKVITVSNNPSIIAQYDSLQIAIYSANIGDTIYIHNSNTSYGNATIRKKLCIIGQGYNTNIQFGKKPDVIITLDGVSDCIIQGISGVIHASNNISNNITIKRCEIHVALLTAIIINGSGWKIYNNIIRAINNEYTGCYFVTINNNSNIIISNNIMNNWNGYYNLNCDYIKESNQSTVIISNNIFLNKRVNGIFKISNAMIVNNVFYGQQPKGAQNCIFNNNLTFNTSNDTIPYGSNSGINNVISRDPEFNDVPDYNFRSNYDYHLKPTSPGINAGTDGTDIGIYGGPFPWPDETGYTGEPAIPQIIHSGFSNKVVGQNSELKLRVKAVKKD